MPRRTRSSGADTRPAEVVAPKRRRTASSSRHQRDLALGGEDQEGRRLHVSDEDFNENNIVVKDLKVGEGTPLHPDSLDFHLKANREAHHTDEYEHPQLIVRRGQAFDLSVTFDREINKDQDKITIQFTTGSRPQESKGTVIRLAVEEGGQPKPDVWHAVQDSIDGATLNLKIVPSCEAIVGIYRVFVETHSTDENEKEFEVRHPFEEEFVVLFNAWCKDDAVYMENEEERAEYVLNEKGRIWAGTARWNGGRPWNFGQFEDVCLDAALYLLDKAELADGARSNPSHVARTMSAMSNSNDEDGGVLEGRWTDTYPKSCTEPWSWNGSVAILEEFMKRKKTVRYGQCWVFSGLVTTLLRALGIPTRSVTNFESAHDTDSSMTIDMHWNTEDKPLELLNDSVWNFHVWNESWFRRPDLPDGYDGWQAHDATPQELSEGVMRCGPCPVKAVKEGHVYLPYDTPFVFGEVNGDRIHWKVLTSGRMIPVYKETNTVGLKISTKAVGTPERNDITNEYKYEEGSKEERAAVHRAFRYSSRKDTTAYDIPDPEVKFELDIPDNVVIGQDFTIKVKMTNQVKEDRKVRARLMAISSYYTGVPCDQLGEYTFEDTVKANADREFLLQVAPEDYIHLVKPEAMVKVYLKATVLETERSYARSDAFSFVKPDLTLEAPDETEIGQPFDLVIKTTNPLNEKLTGVTFHVEAAGIVKSATVHYRKAVKPGEDIEQTIQLTARKAGSKEIVATMSSNQVSGLNGTTEIRVKYQE